MRERILLNVWLISSNNNYMNDVITLFIDLFEKEHPSIRINLEMKSWSSAWNELLQSQISGRGPDVVQIGSTWVAYLAREGYLIDLAAKLPEVGGAEVFDENLFKTCHQAGTGQVNALPWFVDIRGFYYREDILKMHDLTISNLLSWESFVSACEKVNQTEINGARVPALGLGSGLKSSELLHAVMPFIWAAGGDIINEETKEVTINSEQSLKGLEFFFGFFNKGFIPLKCLGLDPAQLAVEYFQGSYCMSVSNVIDVFSMAYTESFYNIDIAKNCLATVFPAGPKGSFAFGGGSVLGIMRNSLYTEEAWELLKFLTGVEAQIYYAKSCGAIPAVKKAYQTQYFSTNPRFKAFNQILKTVRYYPVLTSWGKIEELLVKSLFEVYSEIGHTQGKLDFEFLHKHINKAAYEIKDVLSNP